MKQASEGTIASLAGWMPIRIHWETKQGWVDWCRLRNTLVTDLYSDQTIEKLLNSADTDWCQRTSIDLLRELDAAKPKPLVAGLIFHMSRCGSTLASRMLAASPQNMVIAEANVIDAVVYSKLRVPISEDHRDSLLRGLITAFNLGGGVESQRRLIIKFDSWHVMELQFIRRNFPDAPWVFIYRNPVEVVASHARQSRAPMTAAMGARTAAILAHFCRMALQHLGERGMLIEYRELPDVVWNNLASHFGLECSAGDIDRMRTIAQFNAKDPSVTFISDSEAKQHELPPEIRLEVDRLATPWYHELERRRAGGVTRGCQSYS